MDKRPIGIFDSGVGGLTVARELIRQLPHEKMIYFGDLARIPYGSKSKQNVVKFSQQIIRFLQSKDVKAIIIACNTASAHALEIVKSQFDIPILGVVEAGVREALRSTSNNKIGIIGTEGTVGSGAYERLIQSMEPITEVYQRACPLFVPLVEEGWTEDVITQEVVKRYLAPLQEKMVDTLVLGCTHYPLLKKVIGKEMGQEVTLVDPSAEAVREMKVLLDDKKLLCNSPQLGEHEFCVSDCTHKFENLAKQILNKPMMPIQKIEIENY